MAKEEIACFYAISTLVTMFSKVVLPVSALLLEIMVFYLKAYRHVNFHLHQISSCQDVITINGTQPFPTCNKYYVAGYIEHHYLDKNLN